MSVVYEVLSLFALVSLLRSGDVSLGRRFGFGTALNPFFGDERSWDAGLRTDEFRFHSFYLVEEGGLGLEWNLRLINLCLGRIKG